MQHTFQELVRLRSESHAHAPFCFFNDTVTTYRDLATVIDNMASVLANTGVKAGDRVALMLPNCIDHIGLFFAISRVGATAVPISIHLRKAGLALQLSSSAPQHIVAEASYSQLVLALPEANSIRNVIWRGDAIPPGNISCAQALLAILLETPAPPSSQPDYSDTLDDICAISYTSGTTGAPKGAMLNQRWFQVGAKNAGLLADVRNDDVLFLWEPFYHVAGWMTVLMSLQHAIPIVMVERFSASNCWDQIRRHKATLFHYLGGAMNLLLKQPPRDDDRDNPVRIAWGAAAPTQSWLEFENRFGLKIREGYGISEAGNFTMLNLDGPMGSIGKPVDEFDAWIEDENGQRAATGQIGEIVLRPLSSGITMTAYFNAPEKTAEVLRDGCLYTGDLGYQDAQGYFYFSGRKKEALRRRGENVSAWEVERIVNAHQSVEESAVIGVPSKMGEQDIMVFIKPAPGKTIVPVEIIRWCEAHLAYYQIPRYIHIVEDFPRGPTQRIRKTELPAEVESAWDFEASGVVSHAHRV